MRRNPYQQYRNQQVSTASPAELVGMLYDGALGAIRLAGQCIADRRPAEVHEPLLKAQDILTELRCSLNFEAGGEIATNLDRIYGYAIQLLVDGNVSRDRSKLDAAVALIEPLRDAWRQAQQPGATQPTSAAAGATA